MTTILTEDMTVLLAFTPRKNASFLASCLDKSPIETYIICVDNVNTLEMGYDNCEENKNGKLDHDTYKNRRGN